jgi:hypothetical protein
MWRKHPVSNSRYTVKQAFFCSMHSESNDDNDMTVHRRVN